LPRREEIEAAIAAHNAVDADRQPLLPPAAGRLLAAMFRRSSVCQRSVDDLATDGLDRTAVRRLLRGLIEAGFLSKEPTLGRASTYQLHLPPRRQP
jgi:hypothetical protein